MSAEENKGLIQRFYDEVINGGNLAAIDDIFSEDVVDHAAGRKQNSGIGGIRESIQSLRNAFPDINANSEFMISEGDLIAERWVSAGTHRGRFTGVPPTGKQITVTGINIYRIQDGKIAERWQEWDHRGTMRQLSGEQAPDIF